MAAPRKPNMLISGQPTSKLTKVSTITILSVIFSRWLATSTWPSTLVNTWKIRNPGDDTQSRESLGKCRVLVEQRKHAVADEDEPALAKPESGSRAALELLSFLLCQAAPALLHRRPRAFAALQEPGIFPGFPRLCVSSPGF